MQFPMMRYLIHRHFFKTSKIKHDYLIQLFHFVIDELHQGFDILR